MNENITNLMRENIYAILRRELLDCTIAPGVEIREAEMCERFASSRSPVRDALLRLEGEGLVVIHPRKGYQASPISLSDARDLFGFRALLEPASALAAASSADDAALASLDIYRSIAAFRASEVVFADAQFIVYNREFHLALARLCPNGRLRETTCQVIEQFDRLVNVSITQARRNDHQALVDEHVAIIEAMQARQGRVAARILTTHVERARKRVLKSLSQAVVVP